MAAILANSNIEYVCICNSRQKFIRNFRRSDIIRYNLSYSRFPTVFVLNAIVRKWFLEIFVNFSIVYKNVMFENLLNYISVYSVWCIRDNDSE